jgi:acyl dehydratase
MSQKQKFKLGEFLADSISVLGAEAVDIEAGFPVADWVNIKRFTGALGDNNPLYIDPAYGATTYHYTMIAPPTFVIGMRVPASNGPFEMKNYGEAANLLESVELTWFDTIPLAAKLNSTLKITGACLKTMAYGDLSARECACLTSSAEYFKGNGELVAVGTGLKNFIPFDKGDEWVLERELHRYSDEEIKKIEDDTDALLNRGKRGSQPRYWSDVKVGDELPFIVKGPMTLDDQMAWITAEGRTLLLGALVYKDLLENRPGAIRSMPTTGWPYYDHDQEFEDVLACRDLGFKNANPGRGIMRVALAGQLLTDWMSDAGFLRSLSVTLPAPWVYGDTMWLTGFVTKTYRKAIGNELYHAVEVDITGTNQLQETVLTGTAIVFLPEPGRSVILPVPC